MKKLAVGILAHVDAGKTTLSEGLLYRSGSLKKLGRVDHQDAFLDTYNLERERGITIFSKQAILPLDGLEITLLDTPGHVDFSTEMERTLQVLDYAILVISGTDGVQSHTQTLWRLLARYRIPTFLFVNKMDLAGADRAALLGGLRQRLDAGCVDFGPGVRREDWLEEVAMCDEAALAHYLEQGTVARETVAELIRGRKLFPCYFGSALKLEGVDDFLNGLTAYTCAPAYPEAFGAKVYKIARDPQGNRLSYMKITGGSLQVKAPLTNRREGLAEEKTWEEKVDQIRIYSGARYQAVDEVQAGTVCAVTGLSRTYPGQGLGLEAASEPPALQPVLTYQVILPEGCDPHTALLKLNVLEEEDPQLHIVWNEQLREIHIQLMGEVQLEVLQHIIRERFGLEVLFGTGNIVYRETIAGPVEGVGHFEPLRHYAEVHLLLQPGPRGSGLHFATACGEDQLERNWQRLILTHLEEKTHLGVLTGSPITDMKITLVAGRAHEKHTEGGDFRQATYRAVRQGLMNAESILLEPWYDFRLEVPSEHVGRAMADLQRMAGRVSQPETVGGAAVLTGAAPVANMRDYGAEVHSYTRGRGQLACSLRGYEPCHNQAEVVAAQGYDCQRDLENPADSVFCARGAGFIVKWDHVREYMHVDSGLKLEDPAEEEKPPVRERRASAYGGTLEEDKELMKIYERTYGPIRRRDFEPAKKAEPQPAPEGAGVPLYRPRHTGPEYLLVDGYNIIFAWDKLKNIAQESIDTARQLLMDLLSNYQGYKNSVVILVFDAYKVPGNPGSISKYHNIYVVYTKEAETADSYIEKVTYDIARRHRVKVATSDSAEQMIILGHGALRLSARELWMELQQVNGQIAAILEQAGRRYQSKNLGYALEQAKEKKK